MATTHFAGAKLQNSRLSAAARVPAVEILDVAIQPLVTRYAGIHPVEDQSQRLQCWRGSRHS